MFIEWQINYLLWIQNFREATNNVLTPFFSSITIFGEILIPILFSALIYWCINKKQGEFILLSNSFSLLANQFLKMTFCIERPWILSEDIHPVKSALPYSVGYSFPSGHTACATSIWGSVAAFMWKNKFLRYSVLILIFLIAFSRTYLGVHTPQDVLVSIIVSTLIILGLQKVFLSKHDNKNTIFKIFLFGMLSSIIVLFLIHFKPNILKYIFNITVVTRSMKSFYVNIGYIIGTLSGWFLCRKYVPFSTENISILKRIIRYICGAGLLMLFLHITEEVLIGDSGATKAAFCYSIFLGLYITLIYPYIFTFIERKIDINHKKINFLYDNSKKLS